MQATQIQYEDNQIQYSKKQVRPSGSPRKKSSKRKPVLKNVVSLRVSDKEKEVLEKITESTSKSVSDVIREAIEYWLNKRRQALPAVLRNKFKTAKEAMNDEKKSL